MADERLIDISPWQKKAARRQKKPDFGAAESGGSFQAGESVVSAVDGGGMPEVGIQSVLMERPQGFGAPVSEIKGVRMPMPEESGMPECSGMPNIDLAQLAENPGCLPFFRRRVANG